MRKANRSSGASRPSGNVNRHLFAAALVGTCLLFVFGASSFYGSDGLARRGSVASAAGKALINSLSANFYRVPQPVRDLEPAASQVESASSPAEIELQRLLEHPMEGCPAKWLESLDQYAKWHAEQLTLLRQKSPNAAKVFVYSCAETVDETTVVGDDCGGFADRLVGLAHMFIFSMLYKQTFLVDWSSGGRQLPPHIFHSPYINYTFDMSLVNYTGRSIELRERHYNGCPDHQGPCILQKDDPPAQFSKDVTLTRINKGPVRYSTDAARERMWKELGLDPKNAGGCILRALVQPNPETVDAFREWALKLLDPSVHVVALHVRTGDKSMHLLQPRPENYGLKDKYWECALKLQKNALAGPPSPSEELLMLQQPVESVPPSKAVVFVSVDDMRYKKEAVEAFGNETVWATDVRPWHISKLQLWWDGFIHRKDKFPNPVERLRDTFGEWWLLSLGDDFVMPGFSGYSRTAFAYSQKPRGRNVENYEGKGLCCCDKPLTQADLANLGGGY